MVRVFVATDVAKVPREFSQKEHVHGCPDPSL
jgi:hypothetical protein